MVNADKKIRYIILDTVVQQPVYNCTAWLIPMDGG